MGKSEALFEQAKRRIPGGVNSPVRAFGSVGATPRFIKSGSGAVITDVDGVSYIDYIGSWGPMLLGHNHPVIREAVIKAAENGLSFGAATESEVTMAELICGFFPSIDMVRMVNSGTEAVMSAIRVARGATGRDKILKFEGCYHGHCDAMLVSAGSGLMTSGVSASAGVTAGCARDTLTAPYNDLETVTRIFDRNKGELAAVIIEPVAANMGVVLPEDNFLAKLRALCDANGTLLIFDEVITGFRLGPGGAQERYGVYPDLTTFGKIIGGGMPVGAYGGRRELMEQVSPLGRVYQAGTLSGNPVAMAAGIAQLTYLKEHPEVYEHLESSAEKLFGGLQVLIRRYDAPCALNRIGSLGCLFFTPGPVRDYGGAKSADTGAYAEYFRHMLGSGIYLAPAQFEAMFISDAHQDAHIEKTLAAAEAFFGSRLK
ncbi:glutamate-1-semialdehyde 2,1-aminomutase [Sporobacter termitidis DSM 10068]|uniref:Glutamate-1-semialdehyde 2,1-aminomutase n=1 Tax=Sporobacter termitidis DSM 10068 TaxID=1123282 RepID=A0A1M5XJ84_9FIRM|nr:glutamate-1-semialdehyde 2,1-aminomutase [Sporobacter termitidis]SHH99870.1 glutamate-1-semialdehyde 2,1-aminomutase [Sporobacter termitidis DSM 10068]